MPLAARLGGAENMLWTFLRHIDRRRIEPVVVFLEDGPFVDEVAGLGIETTLLDAGRLRDIRRFASTIRRLGQLFRENQPDLVLNWTAKSQVYGALAAAQVGMRVRVVWWQHGVPERHWLDRLATLLHARAVGCSSKAAAEAQSTLRPRRPTFVVFPGVDSPQLPLDTAGLRRRCAIPNGALVVGIVGRLQPWKGQHHVIGALAELKQRGHTIHGLVVGGNAHNLSPEYEPYLRRLVDDLDLRGQVTFTGQVPDAAAYIELMDVMVNASDPEPFGIVLLEAMARDVAVVAVDSGGPREIVEDGRSGLLIRTSDDVVIADALERLVVDDDLRRRLAGEGRRRVESTFSARGMTEELQSRLEGLARLRATP
jgi:glycosyltransferase involved in cell wall biosynthesis